MIKINWKRFIDSWAYNDHCVFMIFNRYIVISTAYHSVIRYVGMYRSLDEAERNCLPY